MSENDKKWLNQYKLAARVIKSRRARLGYARGKGLTKTTLLVWRQSIYYDNQYHQGNGCTDAFLDSMGC